MNLAKLLQSLKSESFLKVQNEGVKFEKDAEIYAKEINQNIFLTFVILRDLKIKKGIYILFDTNYFIKRTDIKYVGSFCLY